MTVSRVVNGEANVRPATRDRVNVALAALRYTPNQAARHLAGGRLIRVGVLYSNPSASYLGEFLVGLLNTASQAHLQLVVQKCEGRRQGGEAVENPAGQRHRRPDPAPPFCDSIPLIDRIIAGQVPAVAVASGKPDARISAVSIDDRQAAHEMTAHLLGLGHRLIGFIAGHPNQTASERRLSGFRDAMARRPAGRRAPGRAGEFQLPLRPRTPPRPCWRRRPGPPPCSRRTTTWPRPAVAIAHRMRLDVPADLTVVGFDDAPLATTIWPELSTVRQPIQAMAEAAIELLVRQIRAPQGRATGVRERLLMDFSLIRRQSDAPPRKPGKPGKQGEWPSMSWSDP